MADFKIETHMLTSGKLIKLRSANENDLDQYTDFDINTLRTSPLMFLQPEEVSWLNREQVKSRIDRVYQSESDLILIAEDEGKLIGKLEFKCGKRKTLSHKGYIDIAVEDKYRGKGVGSILFEAFLQWAKSQPHIEVIQLSVVEENTAAVALYKKYGFIEIGRDPYANKADGRFFAELSMSLKF